MPLVLAGVILTIGALAAYEVFVAQQPLSALVPWWHPSAPSSIANSAAANAPSTQAALAAQAVNQAGTPPQHVVALPFAGIPPQQPASTPGAPVVHTANFSGLIGLGTSSLIGQWQAKVRSTVATITAGLGLYAPDPVSQLQRQVLTQRLNSVSQNPSKANVQQNVTAMLSPSAGADSTAAAVQLNNLLGSAPPGA